ncbi:aldo-keto reductase family 1 member B1-like [Glossina fuscipes]|uniref:Aldo-keto reductase family 1 member B1-like n=1 Tax=Glossina fuscipes TaxID=7396 RepID=A0A9C5Z7X2_9MUSC|nr:aldo-keto reductase family 1 member B1-like [Glossina fuscipes]
MFFDCFSSARNASTEVPTLCLNNGSKMPALGLGTWGATEGYQCIEKFDASEAPATGRTKPEEMVDAMKCALDIGYRLVDTAFLYKNEQQIGQVIKAKIEEKTLKREDIFVVTKLWNSFHNPKNVKTACEKSLKNLSMDYIDLYLMHTPMGAQLTDDPYNFSSVNKDGKPSFTDDDYICTWQAMEDLVDKCFCKSIGICNFNLDQMKRLIQHAKIKPQVLQMELHPYLTQKELCEYCKCHKIIIMAYSPLGSPSRPWAGKDTPKILLQEKPVLNIAEKHNKTPAQVLIRYPIDLGYATIPQSGKSVEFMKENFDALNFKLCPEDSRWPSTSSIWTVNALLQEIFTDCRNLYFI